MPGSVALRCRGTDGGDQGAEQGSVVQEYLSGIRPECEGEEWKSTGLPTAAIKERRALDARSARQGHWMQGVRGAGKKEWIRLLGLLDGPVDATRFIGPQLP